MSRVEAADVDLDHCTVTEFELRPLMLISEKQRQIPDTPISSTLREFIMDVRALQHPPRVDAGEVQCSLLVGWIRVPGGDIVPGHPPFVTIYGGSLLVIHPVVPSVGVRAVLDIDTYRGAKFGRYLCRRGRCG